jgi:hypothetical protein
MGKGKPSLSIIDLIIQFVQRLLGGNNERLNQAIAANPKYEERPEASSLKDKVWKIITAPYRSQNPYSWRQECQNRVGTAIKLIKKVVGNNQELQRTTWFMEEYLKTLSCLYVTYDEFISRAKPSLSNYA